MMFKRTKDFTKISPRKHKKMLLKAAKYANKGQRKVEKAVNKITDKAQILYGSPMEKDFDGLGLVIDETVKSKKGDKIDGNKK